MKKIIFVFVFLYSIISFGQGPYWLQNAGSNGQDEGYDISIDALGNTYTTGYFTGTAQFGNQSIYLTSSGTTDIFLAKINSQGVYQWAVKAGGTGTDRGLAIRTDAAGNSYITGYYQGTAAFGSTNITSVSSSQDIFLAKYNASGILQWVKSAGGSSGDIGNSVNIDNSGSVYITGQFAGTAFFGSNSLVSMTDPGTGAPSQDVFTAKYNAANGNEIWAEKGSAKYSDRGIDIACDNAGNVYVVGQFSDTITFDYTHNNNMYNACFLVKYNSNGDEQWFRYMGGSTYTVSYGVATDNSSNVYVTGDFYYNMIFFGTPNTSLTNTYPNCIFVAKYNSAGSLQWANSDGSLESITSRNIVTDDLSDAYITGSFQCRLNEYADVYGQGTFNSVGYWDMFVSKYNSSGNWQWARQSGGRQNDVSYGITVDGEYDIYIAGSFEDRILFPVSGNFIDNTGVTSPLINGSPAFFCSDPDYSEYWYLDSYGVNDICIAKGFDISRQPYDYYIRDNGGNCDRPYIGVCIDVTGIPESCPDSAEACIGQTLVANSNTGLAGPDFDYYWSNGSMSNTITASTSGYYWVTQTSADGCFVSTDSIYITVFPLPQKPLISDDFIINTNAYSPQTIPLCYPDSVTIWASNTGSNTYYWTGPGLPPGGLYQNSFVTNVSGIYTINVVDSFGCVNSNSVLVEVDTMIILPDIYSFISVLDSMVICSGDAVVVTISDVISDPFFNPALLNCYTIWTITPGVSGALYPHTAYYFPTQTGTYDVHAEHIIILTNNCMYDSIHILLDTSFYVTVNPRPVVNDTIHGDNAMCQGDTISIYVTGNATNIHWYGPGIITNPYLSSISVNAPGNYYVNLSLVDSNGCWGYQTLYWTITLSPLPVITMLPADGVICPSDSIELICSGSGIFSWYGPAGLLAGNSNSIYVTVPGFYYCVLVDIIGCQQVSNTLEVKQYNTPYLLASPISIICPGDSLVIVAVTNAGSNIEWQPPLSGSSLSQTVYGPGTYYCNITSCGIVTEASVTITLSDVAAIITPDGPLDFCPGDSVVLYGNEGMMLYQWTGGSADTSITVLLPGTYTLTTTDYNGCTAVSSPVTISVIIASPPEINDTTICYGTSVLLSADAEGQVVWYNTITADSIISTGSDYTTPIIFDTITYYLLTVDSGCSSGLVPVNVFIYTSSYPPVVSGNSPVCEGETIELYCDSADGETYSWTGPGGFLSSAANPQIINASLLNSGNYSLIIYSDSCTSPASTVAVQVIENPNIALPDSLMLFCVDEGILLDASFPDGSYQWQDFSANAFYYVQAGGLYWVTVNVGNCKTTDSTQVYAEDCTPIIEMPNVFTPNSDGSNDLFLPMQYEFIIENKIMIFNRWGRLLYESDDVLSGWDGTHDGRECSDGVYFWILYYTG
ncbi:MAG: gliding motility-associated C-terminal domain-containing protein, partial [Bacteroidota bacterium]